MTKLSYVWENFLDGFDNIPYILDCYNAMDIFGYGEFWEALSMGWLRMEDENLVSQPGFDAYKIKDSRYGYYLYVLSNKMFNGDKE
jgi:hypothetical protein